MNYIQSLYSKNFNISVLVYVKYTKEIIFIPIGISTVSSIIKIKTFYENEEKLFEPTSDHYICYQHWIKD